MTRTAVLGALKPAATVYTTAMTVPASQTWLLKHLLISNRAGAADTIEVVVSDGGVLVLDLIAQQAIAAFTTREWAGPLVLGPGHLIQVYSLNGYSLFWLSGAKLIGTA